MAYPDFPAVEPRGGRTWYAVTVRFSSGQEKDVYEGQGDADKAGREALSAFRRYHGAHVEVLADGAVFAYVTFVPCTHDKTPFLCEPGFCWHHQCGQIPPEQCGCG